ncbi:YhgE/Pip domain-containing protein [Alkalihalobacterium bogoriense]|uniref:YhgE/Pip domain-containing protein n=1 Tax=Alkalihalobacterium bogoriense TaxID=246272 RepID=UPI000478A9C5|nr:ABC transporter permease [Alkalihalobacterium bogoriense]
MNTCKAFFKSGPTLVGIGIAFAFLLIFFIVWLTAYDGVSDRLENLRVGIVDHDTNFYSSILEESLPFTTITIDNESAGMEKLNKREIGMLIVIPEGFTNSIQREQGVMEYYINQATPSMSKQMMENAAKEITTKLNEYIFTVKKEQVINVPDEYIKEGMQLLSYQSVRTEIVEVNYTEGFAATMVPLLIILASFVGSMLMSLNLFQVTQNLMSSYNKWSILLSRFSIQLIVSGCLSVLTISLLLLFQFELQISVFESIIFQTLVYLSFLCFTQMFTILFGMAGMLFNIISLSIQLVTAGVIVPRVLLSDFYQQLSTIFPATYGTSGYFTIIYGGASLTEEMLLLCSIIAITFGVTVVRVALTKEKIEEVPLQGN